MVEINVEPTAQAIDNMANVALGLSQRLTQITASMREKKDVTYASEALQEVSGAMGGFRLDLMVTRPVREYQTKLRDITDKK